MKKSSKTRASLLSSVISLTLCFAMLLGTTFAWFTDTASTAVNTIQAGTLDVDLVFAEGCTINGTAYNIGDSAVGVSLDFKKAGNAEDEPVLWEPGCTYELPALKVVNKGNLALKYKIVLSGINGSAELNDVIDWTMVEGENTTSVSLDSTKEYALKPAGESETFTIRGHMQETADNYYQGMTITGIAITVYATQLGGELDDVTGETDSFNNTYDENARYPVEVIPAVESNMTPAAPNEEGTIGSFTYTDDGLTATFTPTTPYETSDSAPKLIVKPTEVTEASTTITEAGLEAVAYDIKLVDATSGAELNGAGLTKLTLDVGKNLKGVQMYHNSTPVTKVDTETELVANTFYYNSNKGTVTFMVNSFSEFAIAYMPPEVVVNGVGCYNFLTALKAAKDGDIITLLSDAKLTIKPLTLTNDVTIDLGGHTITGAKYKSAIDVKGANVLIKNGTIEATPNAAGSALYAEGAANVTVENCTIKSNGNKTYVVCTNGAKSLNSTITIKNSTISAPTASSAKGYALYVPAGTVTFENCNVTGHIFISGGNVTLEGGTYTATGFNGQAKIWNIGDTRSYAKSMTGGNAYTMGDSIFIADRRDGYQLTGVTICNITFNTEITLKDGTEATAYAIKYVDMQDDSANPANLVIENNTYNNQIDSADPVMFIDLNGGDLTPTTPTAPANE